MEALDQISAGTKLQFTKQGDSEATYAPKLRKADGLIDWRQSSVKIHNRVRGLLPWPGAYAYYNDKHLKILQTQVLDDMASSKPLEPGEVSDIIKGKGVIVRTGSGHIVIKYLQLEGKKVMDSDSFVRGHKIEKGYRF